MTASVPTATEPQPALVPEPTAQVAVQNAQPSRKQTALPVLEKLFELYPQLFGQEFVPLQLGVFQELLARHPEHFEREALKTALGVHTRSTRYLQCVAAGKPRHGLDGNALEPVAPEHVHFALLELFRRRASRSTEDLRPKFRAQLIAAFEASGLSRQDYLAKVLTKDLDANALMEEAFAQMDEQRAKQDALLRAFDASGKSAEEFAQMYGLSLRDVNAALARRVQAAG